MPSAAPVSLQQYSSCPLACSHTRQLFAKEQDPFSASMGPLSVPIQCREPFHSVCLASLKTAPLISQVGIFFHIAKLILKCYLLSKCYPKVHFSAKYTKRLGEAEEIGDCIPWESAAHVCVCVHACTRVCVCVPDSGGRDLQPNALLPFCRSLPNGSKDSVFMQSTL